MRAAFPIGLLSCALSAPILAGQTLSFGLQPAAVTVKPGAQAVVRLTVTGAKGNSAAIALSVSGLPAGIGADFAPKTLNGSGTSELRLRTAAALAAGRYSLQIAAKQGTQAAEQALLLEASPSAEFKLQAGTPVLRLVRNRASGSVKLEDHPEGRTDTALAVESAPSGVSVALASNTLAGSGTVSFAVTANRAPAYGRHLIRLKATSNAVAKTVDYVLVVDPPRFEIATPARARGLKRGGSIREVISVRSSAGFEGVVRLSAAKLPAGVTARFEPATVKTGGASVMILTASRAAAAGRIAVQVAGESGGTVQSQTLMLAVGDPDFDLTVTPATRTVKAGDAFSATVGIAPQNGFQGTVTLSASGLNAGSTVTFAPAVLSGQSDSQMEVRTSPSLAAGTYVLTITATSGSTVHTAAMTVVVSDIPTFAVFCNPQTHLLLAGYSTTLSVELDPLNGFNGAVQLSVAGLPDGVQSSFQPQSFAADSWGIGVAKWSTLTLTSLANLEPGTYPIAITAASADDVDVAEVSLIVARPLSAPWTSLDVGSVAQAGASGIAAEVGTFVLQGSGAGVTSSSDGFHYAFQDLNGNGEIVARVTGLQNAGSYSVAGVMIRAGLAPGAAHAFVGVRATGAAAFHSRPSLQAGTSASSWSTGSLPRWVRLVREGNLFTGYVSPDGASWTQLAPPATIPMQGTVSIGLCATVSGSGMVRALFDNVQVLNQSGFLLSAAPGATITASSVTYALKVSAVGSFNGTVTLSATGGPAGTTLSFTPAALTGSGNSVLVVTPPANAAAGTYGITVTAQSGGAVRTLPLSLVVSATGAKYWASQDIGTVGATGSTALNGSGVYETLGAGIRMGVYANYGDTFRFVYQPLNGDGEIVARVYPYQISYSDSLAGVMIRSGLTAEASHATIGFQPAGKARWVYRTAPAADDGEVDGDTVTLPRWAKVVRTGNVFTGFVSPDGVAWTQLGSAVTIPMSGEVYIGLMVCGWGEPTPARFTFDSVAISAPRPFVLQVSPVANLVGSTVTHAVTVQALNGFSGQVDLSVTGHPAGSTAAVNPASLTGGGQALLEVNPGTAPAGRYVLSVTAVCGAFSQTVQVAVTIPNPVTGPWEPADIGSPGIAGVSTLTNGTYTLKASGDRIDRNWNGSDSFHFVWQKLKGNVEIVARLVSKTGGQAGLMMRETTDAGSKNVFLMVDTSNYGRAAWRSATGDGGVNPNGVLAAAPRWLRLLRAGAAVTAFLSADGAAWTPISAPQTFLTTEEILVGLAATSLNNSTTITAVFDNVSVTASQSFFLTCDEGASVSAGAATYTVWAHPAAGYGGTVNLSVSGLPPGVTASWSNPSVALGVGGPSGSARLTLTVPANLVPGSYPVTVTATDGALTRTATIVLLATDTPAKVLAEQDIGAVRLQGTTVFDGTQFTLASAGLGLNGYNSRADRFRFVWLPLGGDGEVVARLVSKTGGQGGVSIRQSLDTNAANVYVQVDESNKGRFSYRPAPSDGPVRPDGSSAPAPRWLRLVRQGNNFSGYLSTDGTTWTQTGSTVTVAMGTTVYAGLVTGNTDDTPVTAVFDNFRVTPVGSFLLSISPAAQTAPVGAVVTYTLPVTAVSGFADPVTLAVSGVPTGASAVIVPNPAQPGTTAQLSVGLSETTPAGVSTLTVTGVSGSQTRTAQATLTALATGFSVTANPTSRTIRPGTSGTYTFTVTAQGGFNRDVTFQVQNLPAGVGGNLSQTTIHGSGAIMLTVTAAPGAPTGTSSFQVLASSGGQTQTLSLSLTLTNSADFVVTVDHAARTVRPGAEVKIGVSVESLNGFHGGIALGVGGLPTGSTASFAPPSLVSAGSSVLTVVLPADAPAAPFPLTIRAISGSTTRTAATTLLIDARADYSVAATPSTQTVNAGQTAVYAVTVEKTRDFAGEIRLGVLGLPAGVTAAFSPAVVTGSGSSTLTLTTSAGTPAGAFQFMATGASGSVIRTTSLGFEIASSADFTLTAVPATVLTAQSAVTPFAVTITATGAFDSPVTLQASGGPAGAGISFAPATIQKSGTSVMTVTVPAAATPGDYTVTITAAGGGRSHQTSVVLQVRAAQQYEAEAAGNTNEGTAAVVSCGACSGGALVDNLGKNSGGQTGALTFNGITIATSGRFAMTVYYANGDAAPHSALISVNGGTGTLSLLAPSSGGWTRIASATREITLRSGANTIRFSNPDGRAPAIDRITLVQTATCSPDPLDVMLVMDRSGSMQGTPMTNAKNAAKAFVDLLDPAADLAGLASFAGSATLNWQLGSDFAGLKTAIDGLTASGGTYIGSGITAANTEFQSARHRANAGKVMVVLTDGVDNPSNPGTVTAANAAKAAGTRVITIGYGTNIDADFLRGLASSPSDYYASPSTEEIGAIYASIATSLCRPPNTAPEVSAGPNHAVAVNQTVTLGGAAGDDGLPAAATLAYTWSLTSGPASVTFSTPNAAATDVVFPAAGVYTVRLTASDGELSSYSEASYTVMAAGTAQLEAESSTSILAGGAQAVACAACSGGGRVDGIGAQGGTAQGSVTFHVTVASQGYYTLNVYYSNGDSVARTAQVSVNGDSTARAFGAPPTGAWEVIQSAPMSVWLVAGANTVKFSNPAGAGPSIDRIELVFVADPVCAPGAIDVALILDRSGSMAGDPLTKAKAAAQLLIDQLQWQTDQTSLFSYAADAVTHSLLTRDGPAVKLAADTIVSGGSTFAAAAVAAARTELTGPRRTAGSTQVLVLLTDGQIEDATQTTTEASAAKAAGIRILTIGLGDVNPAYLQSLASSPSDYYYTPTPAGLVAIYQSVATSLCRPPNQAPFVSAGVDRSVVLPQPLALQGVVADDALPSGVGLTARWTKVSGPGAVTFAPPDAAYTTASFSAAGLYTLELSASDGQKSASAQMKVQAVPSGAAQTLTLEPSGMGPNLTGTSQVVRARLRDSAGAAVVGAQVSFQVSGPNAATGSAITGSNGVAEFTLMGVNRGTDTILASVAGGATAGGTVAWTYPAAPLTISAVRGRIYSSELSNSFSMSAGEQPLFERWYPTVSFNPRAEWIASNTSGVYHQGRPLTFVGSDFANTYTGTIQVAGNGYVADQGSLSMYKGVYTGSLLATAAGDYTLELRSDDGMLFGVGNGAQRVSGPMEGVPAGGTTYLSGLPILAGANLAEGTHTIVVRLPAPGVYPFEIDHAKGAYFGNLVLRTTVAGNLVIVPPAALLRMAPFGSLSRNRNDRHTLTLLARENSGHALAGLPVRLVVTGGHAQVLEGVTDSNGYVTFSYQGTISEAVDRVQAEAAWGGTMLTSTVATITWSAAANAAPVVDAGPDQTASSGELVQLHGTATDDGQPSWAPLNIQWSKVSGPGDVTFTDPKRARTSALFSAAGTYVLKLSAGDTVYTTEDTVTVTITAASVPNGGWFASPAYGAEVSGLVPLTLLPEITLTGGTLTWWPAEDETAVRTLNANTTGGGTIGTLDTTTLPNGSLWVRLAATNTLGQTQTSLLQLFVVGENKPGRAMTRATDFTVPLAGLPIAIERSYDSLERHLPGDFGYGWRLSATALRWQVNPGEHVTVTINGQRKTFYFTPESTILGWFIPKYTAEPGFYGKLENTGDSCTGLLLRVSNQWRCGMVNDVYRANGWRYTDPAGRLYTVDAAGKLTSLKDLNGNTLTVAPDGITSSAGNLRIAFVRDAAGRITQITDPLGKHYLYGYNAQGELETVTYPSVATPAQYTYDPGHLLKTARDMRGNLTASVVYDAAGRVQSETDAAGHTRTYAYDVAARTTTITNPDTGVEVIETDARGNVVRKVDGLNRTTTFTYDTKNNLLTETNPLGKTTTYTYDANGFKTSTRDPLNRIHSAAYNAYGGPLAVTNPLNFTQSVTYDGNYNVRTITDPVGQVAEFTWNAKGLPLTMKDARGNTSSYGYDVWGNRIWYTDPEGRTTLSTYNAFGQLLSQTDARGNTTTYTYNDLGQRTAQVAPDGSLTTYEYDANGNKTAEVDPLLRRTTFTYDAKNRLIRTTYPDSTYTETTYDFRDQPLTVRDQGGRITRNVYDLAGQLTSVTYAWGTADAATVSYTYDGAGRKLTETDERGLVTTYGYNDAGELVSVTNAQNKVTGYGYDAAGRRTSMTDPRNRVTTYEYDGRGRMTKTTYPDTRYVTHTYDGLGLRLTTTDQENRTTTWGYDKASQLVSVTNPLNQVTTYGYDANGNKIRQTDANNHTTTYEYDKLNRRTKRTLPLGQYEAFTYDAAGNLATRRDFNGATTSYTYDTQNRLLTKGPISFTYTPTGKRLTMVDPSGTTTYSYDNRDRLLTKATPQGTLTYSYLPNSLVASVLSSNANGVSVSYGYDTLNRLETVTDNRLGNATALTYTDASEPLTMAYPNGVVHSFTHDSNGRVSQVTNNRGGSFAYTRRYAGAIETVTETGRSVSYTYDLAQRLLTETITPSGSLAYTLDPVANRLTRTSDIPELPSGASAYDANDRLTTDTYDANGNTLSSNGHTYGYDFEDRLTSYDAGTVVFAYDGDGNRVSRTAGGVTTRYLIDDLTPTGYAQVAEELQGGAVVRRYTHGTQRISQTQLIGGIWTPHYYGYDGGGTVRQLFDAVGVVTDTYNYDAFGTVIGSTGTTPNTYLYRGEHYDATLDMYYLRARWYWPKVGRFVTADTYEGLEMFPLSLQRYMFAEANPVANTDPGGRMVEAATIYEADLKGLLETGVVLTGAMFGCRIAECGGEHRGKFHAQGSDFRDAGTGRSETWFLPVPMPRLAAMLQLTALMTQLSDTQVANRLLAYGTAMEFLANTSPRHAHFEQSFPTENRRQLRRLTQSPTCPDGDCRIDVEVLAGWAFTGPI